MSEFQTINHHQDMHCRKAMEHLPKKKKKDQWLCISPVRVPNTSGKKKLRTSFWFH